MYIFNRDTYLVGDVHGKLDELETLTKQYDITNADIILLGDIGVGFSLRWQDTLVNNYQNLNNFAQEFNLKFFLIRGNHDNPAHWENSNMITQRFENIIFLHANEHILIDNKKYIIVPGAVSLDRSVRTSSSYWSAEEIQYPFCRQEELVDVEGIISHVGPVPISLAGNSPILDYWLQRDKALTDDLKREKYIIDQIYNNIKPKKWFYGHYHVSEKFTYGSDETSVNCICLDELEFHQINYAK